MFGGAIGSGGYGDKREGDGSQGLQYLLHEGRLAEVCIYCSIVRIVMLASRLDLYTKFPVMLATNSLACCVITSYPPRILQALL